MPQTKERAIDYEFIGKTMMHSTQQEILERLLPSGEALSPVEFTKIAGGTIGSVSYHFVALRRRGWIKLADTKPRRGALEHYYALAPAILTENA